MIENDRLHGSIENAIDSTHPHKKNPEKGQNDGAYRGSTNHGLRRINVSCQHSSDTIVSDVYVRLMAHP